MTLDSASLASPTSESKTTWVKESIENSTIKTRALQLGIKWTRGAIPLVPTYLVLGKELVSVPGCVSDKGSDKGPFVLHVETFGPKDEGKILGDHVVFCFPIKTMIATKGIKIEPLCPDPDTYVPKSEIKENVKRASSTMRDPATHAVNEEMREFGKNQLSQAE